VDAIEAMEQFLSKIEPYDPHPDVATAALEMRVGRARGSFTLSDRAAKALVEVLARYSDPDDCGKCPNCGRPLGSDLRCQDCGWVDGIFGEAVASHAAEVRRRFAEEARNWQPR
jgi:hypothetical protein